MKDRLRYWWNWLLSKNDWQLLVGGFVFGCAAGVLAYDIRSDWLTNGLLISLESECQNYMGQRAMLVYHEKRFYCLPERP
jgi:hypothetical protein